MEQYYFVSYFKEGSLRHDFLVSCDPVDYFLVCSESRLCWLVSQAFILTTVHKTSRIPSFSLGVSVMLSITET